jgi:mannose/fructose-specific phosphotransferase system component IIA
MTGILLITYGHIGKEILQAASHILGQDVEDIVLVSVYDQTTTTDSLPAQIEGALQRIGENTPCLIMTDLHGCTHFNVASRYLQQSHVALVSGLNLPMLLRVLNHRDEDIDSLLHYAEAGGTMGISSLNMTSIEKKERM